MRGTGPEPGLHTSMAQNRILKLLGGLQKGQIFKCLSSVLWEHKRTQSEAQGTTQEPSIPRTFQRGGRDLHTKTETTPLMGLRNQQRPACLA